MNEEEPNNQVPKKHPAEDFLRATRDARASRLPDMPAMMAKSRARRKWIVLLTIASVFLSISLIVRFVGIHNANRRLAPAILSVELSPQNAFRWTLLGDAYSEEGRLSDSERAYKKAIKLSGAGFGLTGLGQLYEKQGRLDEALVCYEKARDFESEGDVDERLGRTSDAVEAYRRAIESFRKASEAKNASYLDFGRLGRVFEKLHDKASARQTYAEGLKRGTGADFWRNELQKKLVKIDLEISQNAPDFKAPGIVPKP
jgi:tetratricopeptide (TPR) repeat protein